uniref:HAT C-terminal dimerisation domain-containing protein n=1 Tax=Nelumbo nucifera TaxID=4432 RepID=A0A822YP77_NELNU|nr:TPA_asm: hypothetical protein HUJ06_011980 [Nelumbo nucifera]
MLMMSRFKKYKLVSGGGDAKSELDRYLNEDTEEGQVPISIVVSKSTFSTGGRVLDAFRSFLTPKAKEILICTRDWTQSSQHAVNVEEDLEEIDNFENGNTLFCSSFIWHF